MVAASYSGQSTHLALEDLGLGPQEGDLPWWHVCPVSKQVGCLSGDQPESQSVSIPLGVPSSLFQEATPLCSSSPPTLLSTVPCRVQLQGSPLPPSCPPHERGQPGERKMEEGSVTSPQAWGGATLTSTLFLRAAFSSSPDETLYLRCPLHTVLTLTPVSLGECLHPHP